MATSNRKSAASTAKKRTTSSKSKRGTAKIQDSFFKRNKLSLIIFVLLFGAIGVYLLVKSLAATPLVQLSVGNTFNCIAGATLEPCNFSYPNRVYYDITGTSGFAIKSQNNLCLDGWGQIQTVAGATNRKPVHYVDCWGGANQTWHWGGADGHELVNNGTHGCLNSLGSTAAGTTLGTYSCNNDPNEKFTKTYINSIGGDSGGPASTSCNHGDVIGQAHCYDGNTYRLGGGPHGAGTYTAYHNSCSDSQILSNTFNCEVDCSGLVSAAIDRVYGKNYGWHVDSGTGVMIGTSGHWHLESVSSAKPGDIVTRPDHVEFLVSHKSDGGVNTIGAHSTAKPDGPSSAGPGYYTKAYYFTK